MRFAVEQWDPSYGAGAEFDPGPDEQSSAQVDADVEMPARRWCPVDPAPAAAPPSATLFVDGVRRIDARAWVESSAALCASYAAGVVRCREDAAELLAVDVRRGLFATAAQVEDVDTDAASYAAVLADARPGVPAVAALGSALQARLTDTEIAVASAARAGLATDDDLLVVDGPLRGRQHLPRALGYIKSHRAEYLPDPLSGLVAELSAGQRTPVFLLGTSWHRYSWYLRLPCPPGPPWAGIVRLECGATHSGSEAVAMARLSQATLGRYASEGYKDARAPQNLHPIAGLERQLRRRLGDAGLLYRALRRAENH